MRLTVLLLIALLIVLSLVLEPQTWYVNNHGPRRMTRCALKIRRFGPIMRFSDRFSRASQ